MRYLCEWPILAENRWPHIGRKLTGPRAEKPDEVKVSRPVWEWRRGSDSPCDHNSDAVFQIRPDTAREIVLFSIYPSISELNPDTT